MDWWLKTGTMKRKLNEKASNIDKEKVVQPHRALSRRGVAFKTLCFSPAETAR